MPVVTDADGAVKRRHTVKAAEIKVLGATAAGFHGHHGGGRFVNGDRLG